MNFLQLCNRLHSEMNDSGTGLTTVVNQTGRYLKIVNAVREAWMDIQDDCWDAEFFGAKPDTDPVEYYSRTDPQVLTEQLDVPFIPEQYHLVIVFQAMKKMSLSLNAPELRALADEGYSEKMGKLVNRYIGSDFGKAPAEEIESTIP